MTLHELEKCLRMCIEVNNARELVHRIIEYIRKERPNAEDLAVSFKNTLMKLTVNDIIYIAKKTGDAAIFGALIRLWLMSE